MPVTSCPSFLLANSVRQMPFVCLYIKNNIKQTIAYSRQTIRDSNLSDNRQLVRQKSPEPGRKSFFLLSYDAAHRLDRRRLACNGGSSAVMLIGILELEYISRSSASRSGTVSGEGSCVPGFWGGGLQAGRLRSSHNTTGLWVGKLRCPAYCRAKLLIILFRTGK